MIVVEFKSIVRWIGIALLAITIWLVWWCQPDRQVRRAQRRLLDAIESRDPAAIGQLIAGDYRDRWGHDKAFVLRRTPEVFRHFLTIDLDGEIRGTDAIGDDRNVHQKIIVSGTGTFVANMVRERINGFSQPFTMTWRKKSWKPWDWELWAVDQPELELREWE